MACNVLINHVAIAEISLKLKFLVRKKKKCSIPLTVNPNVESVAYIKQNPTKVILSTNYLIISKTFISFFCLYMRKMSLIFFVLNNLNILLIITEVVREVWTAKFAKQSLEIN